MMMMMMMMMMVMMMMMMMIMMTVAARVLSTRVRGARVSDIRQGLTGGCHHWAFGDELPTFWDLFAARIWLGDASHDMQVKRSSKKHELSSSILRADPNIDFRATPNS